MTRVLGVTSVILLVTASLNAAIARGQGSTGSQSEEEFARVGEATTRQVCGSCHVLEEVTATRRTVRDWSDTVTRMVNAGASGTDAQFDTARRYLTRYVGLVGVNSAPAAEFSAVLGLTETDAKAIVAYRQANGKFANIEALLKVPGIDKSKVEAQPDALRFD